LTARSGRHALKHRIAELGSDLPDAEFEKVYAAFLSLADKKKEVYDEDIEALISDKVKHITEVYALKNLRAESGTGITPTATVEMMVNGKTVKQTGNGDGPVDAVYRTIAEITGTKSRLEAYLVKGITGGTDAQGEVTVKVEEGGKKVAGHGADTDIIIASAKAYVNALNKLEYWKKGKGKNS
jgi:2-isopropylmalate synthase